MDAVDTIADAVRRIGYRPEGIVRDYAFADVLDSANATREVALAAFTQTPPSYRSAALGAVRAGYANTSAWVMAHRSLGAPLLFVIEGDGVTLWQVRGAAPPRVLERLALNDVPGLFERHQEEWRPQAIHRAKAIGGRPREYQLDFVDVGLMPALEGEVHVKLDRLLEDTLTASSQAPCDDRPDTAASCFASSSGCSPRRSCRTAVHAYSRQWDASDLASVLRAIESFYSLPAVPKTGPERRLPPSRRPGTISVEESASRTSRPTTWPSCTRTRSSPARTRKDLGTHSTPRQLAEYAVARLHLDRHDLNDLDVYEPFAGAGTFLVSALRHVRDLLPVHWTDQGTPRLSGGSPLWRRYGSLRLRSRRAFSDSGRLPEPERLAYRPLGPVRERGPAVAAKESRCRSVQPAVRGLFGRRPLKLSHSE